MKGKKMHHGKKQHHKPKGDSMRISRFGKSHKEILPAKFFTTLRYAYNAYEAQAATAAVDFNVWANNPNLPAAVTAFNIGSTALLGPPGTPVDMNGVTTVNGKCLGLSRLMTTTPGANLYSTCHVLRSRINVTYVPYALADSLYLTVCPQKDSDSGPINSILLGEEAPYSKSQIITTSTPHKDMTVRNSINLPKYLGISEQSYLSNSAYSYNIANSTAYAPAKVAAEGAQVFWTIRRSTLNGTVVASAQGLPYRVEVEYDVVFQGPVNQDIPVI